MRTGETDLRLSTPAAAAPYEPDNAVLAEMMAAWNDTFGSPYTRYRAIYKVVETDVLAQRRAASATKAPSEEHKGLRWVAGRQREADARFLYGQAKSTEWTDKQREAIEFMADLVSKNTLVVDATIGSGGSK